MVTVTDRKQEAVRSDTLIDHYDPDVVTANDYYPFGMLEPGRNYNASGVKDYRYGFNGKENDNEVKGEGEQLDYGMRVYDPRLGKFLSVDPLTKSYPPYSPYIFAGNKPIEALDLDGLEEYYINQQSRVKDYAQLRQGVDENIKYGAYREHLISNQSIADRDIYGQGHIGPRYVVQQNIQAIKNEYNQAVGENIRGGPFGATGYLVAGDKGSFYGATADNVALSFGGISGKSSVLSKPGFKVETPTQTTPSEVSGGNDDAAEENATRIHLKISAPPQPGKGFTFKTYQTSISNGRVNVVDRQVTTGRFDFVITNDGKLVIGAGHYTLSSGMESVKAAGQLKIVNGQIKAITNSSGHYKPTILQGQSAVEQLKNMGVNVSGARVTLYNTNGTVNKTYINQ